MQHLKSNFQKKIREGQLDCEMKLYKKNQLKRRIYTILRSWDIASKN